MAMQPCQSALVSVIVTSLNMLRPATKWFCSSRGGAQNPAGVRDVSYSLQLRTKPLGGFVRFLPFVTSLCIFVLGPAASAITAENNSAGVCSDAVIFENDFLIFDRNYTTGLLKSRGCFSEGTEPKDPEWHVLRDWNRALFERVKHFFGHSESAYRGNSLYWGFSLHTPNDLNKLYPDIEHERPYSSLFMFGDNVVYVDEPNSNGGGNKESVRAIKQGLQLGFLGSPLGGKIQTALHDFIGNDEPIGWPNEISRGGELTVLYSLHQKHLLCIRHEEPDACANKRSELTATWGGTAGYYNSLQGGFSARFGRIRTPFWVDYGPIHLRNSAATKALPNTKNGFDKLSSSGEAYLFMTGGADVVLYNAQLQGQFRDNRFEVDAADISRVTPYVSAGFVIDLWKFQISVSYNFRGRELKGGKSHRWTSISIGCSL